MDIPNSLRLRCRVHVRTTPMIAAVILIGLTGAAAAPTGREAQAPRSAAIASEVDFTHENDAAMTRMMAGMDVKPSGDVDRDFTAMMIAHHQGAIDMAVAELRHGGNEQLKRIAQEIIVDQQQEIGAMRLAVGQSLPPSSPAPTQGSHE